MCLQMQNYVHTPNVATRLLWFPHFGMCSTNELFLSNIPQHSAHFLVDLGWSKVFFKGIKHGNFFVPFP